MSIDLNCDMGEGMPNDAALMPYISSANIACGAHAGDETTMRQTVELCLKHGVAIGAHPGFSDKENFGRSSLNLSWHELYVLVKKQLEKLSLICDELHTSLHHVKPHGELYNMAAKDKTMSVIIAKAVLEFNSDLILYGLSNSYMISEAKAAGLKTANEVFSDRTYQSDGSLTPRSQPNALITDVDACTSHVLQMVKSGKVITVNVEQIKVQAQTVCIHGDGPHAVDIAKAIHGRLLQEGITIKTIH